MTAEKILETARKYIGVKEAPPGSNNVVFNTAIDAYYGREVSGPSYPWCCVFVWYVFKEAGASELFFGGEQTASCTTLYNYHKAQGQAVPIEAAKPGDLVFFVFDGNKNGIMNHVGICESTESGYITTIDGNTGSSEANGGAVMRKRRAIKWVGGVIRPAYQNDITITTVAEARKIVQQKAGLADSTMDFLYNYRYGDDLLIKLAKAMQ